MRRFISNLISFLYQFDVYKFNIFICSVKISLKEDIFYACASLINRVYA